MRPILSLVPALLLSASALAGQAAPARTTLDIYLIDTEGGQATLFVTPSGESVLVDTGNPGGRDVGRIVATMAEAGVQRIDHLLLTHYHGDHVGGVMELAARVPILHYVDHGPSVEAREAVPGFAQAYAALHGKARHTVVKAGDRLAVRGLEWEIVSAAGEVLRAPRRGAGRANPACSGDAPPAAAGTPAARDENAQSTGSVIGFGRFTAIDLGDLLVEQERALMCPANRVGTVDLYITSHHGLHTSGSRALVHGLRPRVAVMNNGTRKGGAVPALQVLHASPGLEDLWQLHWSHNGGVELNAPGVFIANVDDPATTASVLTATPGAPGAAGARPAPHDGPAYWIRVSARQDGSFTVTNARNGFSKSYGAAGAAR